MATLTTWDKVRSSLGFGVSKKTEAAIAAEARAFAEQLRKDAEIRKAKLEAEAKAKAKAEAEAATKKPVAKKPAAKPAPKAEAKPVAKKVEAPKAKPAAAKKNPGTKKK